MHIRKVVSAVVTLPVLIALMGATAQPAEEWAAHYGGRGEIRNVPTAMVLDPQGNFFVTGESNRDYATLKYDPNGIKLWEARYDGLSHGLDIARAIVVDSLGNVYVTGESYSGTATHGDCVTIKYDTTGRALWTQRYNGPGNATDAGVAIAVDKSGNVYVTGESYGGTETFTDYVTLKYNQEGQLRWAKRFNGAGNGQDHPSGLTLDDEANIYVTGYTFNGKDKDMDFTTIKYNPEGQQVWAESYNGPNSRADLATGIMLDGKGGVYVTGGSFGAGSQMDFCTIKYSVAGAQLWVKRYNGPGNGLDVANVLKVDGDGNVLVAGHSESGPGHGLDYAVLKYSPDGEQLWTARYNGPGNGEDKATAITLDQENNIYVTGSSDGGPGFGLDYATLKLDPSGHQVWVHRYNDADKGVDAATGIAIGPKHEVYVTGYSSAQNRMRYTTLKYRSDTNQGSVAE